MKAKEKDKFKLYIIILAVILLISVCFLLALVNSADAIDGLLGNRPTLDPEADFIKVFSVGEGDSILLCSNGQKLLLDAGPEAYGNKLCSKIRNEGITQLDAVLISHLHEDHIGGLSKVSDRFKISNIILPDLLSSDEDYVFEAKAAKNDVLNSGGRAYTAVQGMVSYCGDFELTVLGCYEDMKDENNRSVFLMVRYNDIKFLFTGDAESEAEKRLMEDNINFDCDILKVGHHGSNTSTGEEFLKIATPRYAVISVGADNQYSHPGNDVLERLEAAGTEIHRTDLEGDITLHFYPDGVNISSERVVNN